MLRDLVTVGWAFVLFVGVAFFSSRLGYVRAATLSLSPPGWPDSCYPLLLPNPSDSLNRLAATRDSFII